MSEKNARERPKASMGGEKILMDRLGEETKQEESSHDLLFDMLPELSGPSSALLVRMGRNWCLLGHASWIERPRLNADYVAFCMQYAVTVLLLLWTFSILYTSSLVLYTVCCMLYRACSIRTLYVVCSMRSVVWDLKGLDLGRLQKPEFLGYQRPFAWFRSLLEDPGETFDR